MRASAGEIAVEHRLTFAGRTHTISVTGEGTAACPAAGSVEHFFKEHRWGYGTSRRGRLIRYEVVHPVWDCYRVRSFGVDMDWGAVYGPEWGFLAGEAPFSTMLAAGADVLGRAEEDAGRVKEDERRGRSDRLFGFLATAITIGPDAR